MTAVLPSLSPARRRLVLGAVAVLLAVLGAVAFRVVAGSPAPLATEPADQSRPGPVLLVPGYGGSVAAVEDLASRLRAEGRDARVVALPGDATGDLADQADVLDTSIRGALADGAPSVDLVGYSAGGVVVRLWAARDEGNAAAVRRAVTLGSPHHGTTLAGLAVAQGGAACPTACQQLAPGSALLDDLTEAPAGPVWTSVWTDDDDVVVPPASAALAGAVNIGLQSVCPDAVISHGDVPRDPLVRGVVLRALDVASPTQLGRSDCDALRARGGQG